MYLTIPATASEALRRKGEAINARRKAFLESWPGWTHTLLVHLQKGEMRAAANMVSCCTRHDSATAKWSAQDEAAHRVMFTHPTVLANAPAMWAEMQDGMITAGFESQVRDELLEAGWQI